MIPKTKVHKKKEKNIKIAVVCILLIWILLSLARSIFNFSKVLTEERRWISMSDSKKKELLFGDIHNFLLFVNKNTNSNSITLITNNYKAHYYAKYVLYPMRVDVMELDKESIRLSPHTKTVGVYLSGDSKLSRKLSQEIGKNYKLIDSYKGIGSEVGEVYFIK